LSPLWNACQLARRPAPKTRPATLGEPRCTVAPTDTSRQPGGACTAPTVPGCSRRAGPV
jgi:hypothetical protein